MADGRSLGRHFRHALSPVHPPLAAATRTRSALRTSFDLLTAAEGLGRSSIWIPNATGLLGAQFFCQAAHYLGSTWGLSNGIAVRPGL